MHEWTSVPWIFDDRDVAGPREPALVIALVVLANFVHRSGEVHGVEFLEIVVDVIQQLPLILDGCDDAVDFAGTVEQLVPLAGGSLSTITRATSDGRNTAN